MLTGTQNIPHSVLERNRAGALIFVVLLSSLGVCQEAGFISTIQKVKQDVLPIVCGWRGDGQKEMRFGLVYGTGFFVSYEAHFVSARHVLEDLRKASAPDGGRCTPLIYIPVGGWEASAPDVRWFDFDLAGCAEEKQADLAVCRTRVNPFAESTLKTGRLHFWFGKKPTEGTSVAFTGFPLNVLQPITSVGEVAGYEFAASGESHVLIIDKGTWPGASGSPVYLQNGQVVGIVLQRGIGEGVGLTFARPTHFILDFLSARKIPIWTEDQPQNKPQRNTPNP